MLTIALKFFKSANCALFICFHGLPALSQYSKHIIYCTMKILLNINLVYSCIVTTINYYHQISITIFVKVYPYTNTIQGIPATIGAILRTKVMQFSVKFSWPKFWNTFPQELIQAPSLSLFKTKMKHHLLSSQL